MCEIIPASSPLVITAEWTWVLRNPLVWGVVKVAFVAFTLNLFFNNWLPMYLVDTQGFDLRQGDLFVADLPVIGAVTRIVSGNLSVHLLNGRCNPLVLGFLLVITPVILLLPGVDAVALLLAILSWPGSSRR